jgi:hypothetical protein
MHGNSMKRYRVTSFSFDSRPLWLTQSIPDHWDDNIRQQYLDMREQQIAVLESQYGEELIEHKIRNISDLGTSPFSIISYHTAFLRQIRSAFVGFAYYPALTGACALGERILNHMVLKLRGCYSDRPEYKRVHRKSSFDDWKLAIDVLECWDILLPPVVVRFRELHRLRNEVIHFRPELEEDPRTPALEAIRLIQEIIAEQFSAIPTQPWFIPDTPGESYIRKAAEQWPFVREFLLPSCPLVGPYHTVAEITSDRGFVIIDDYPYENREITDEEFAAMRLRYRSQ